MDIVTEIEADDSEFVEVDPTGRYGRYDEILGKGASKTVYRAFDEYEGIEVAWNQVKLYDFMQNPEDLERLYCEIHLLKTLKHKNIMKFYTSWVDVENRNINFVTEMFTSGTLRQYRLKHKKVNIRAVKHWCKQILEGLMYLHSCDPPVIHRDLKCDNIFINGNQGEVKIGDLGLAAILRKSHAAHCVGTPEFMAPEVYAEEYNELVDIYSFGMCILEIVTFEYPYSECTHPAQIYKKVTSGKKPDALYKVTDPEVRRFIEKCLAAVSDRLSARELLDDPFLQVDDFSFDLRLLDYKEYYNDTGPMSLVQPLLKFSHTNCSLVNDNPNCCGIEQDNCHPREFHTNEIDLFVSHDSHYSLEDLDISIEGQLKEDNDIFLRLRIADKQGRVRNIYFPFDLEKDTAMSVASEMVSELDITDQDVTKISEMIDGEIISLVPDWKCSSEINETPNSTDADDYDALRDCISSHSLEVLQQSKHGGCGAVHGRFEEITFQYDESVSEGPPRESNKCVSMRDSTEANSLQARTVIKDYENDIRQEMRWLKAKYAMQLRGLKDHQLGLSPKLKVDEACENEKILATSSLLSIARKNLIKCDNAVKTNETGFGSYSPFHMVSAKSHYTGDLLPHSLNRATSLPVDAIDF
ncbi:unnamed protein product [Cuscuta europaea]|uniref:non-specific serine/threonine protein kinase n=1 Tax=Cuscuta europaea TaxID=41803 RepID=A0A9P0ZHR0_CUSEU|nr:unnamed protein product [Cuscuta europaea]